MFAALTNHSTDLQRLREEGFVMEACDGWLIIHHIPYINATREMKDGTLRYASWKASSSISDKPELVISGGKQNEDTYIFVNDGVTYEAFYQEKERHADGDTYVTDYLRILKNGQVIDKQEILYPNE